MLERIKTDLLDGDALAELRRRVARASAAKPVPESNDKRIGQLRTEVANRTEAIASGALRTSKAVAERLALAEGELERLSAQPARSSAKVLNLPTQIEGLYHCLVASLEAELSRDVHKARAILHRLIGNEIPVEPHASGKHLVARIGLDMQELTQAAGGCEIFVVAGTASSFIAPIPSWCGRFRQASSRRDETLCNALHRVHQGNKVSPQSPVLKCVLDGEACALTAR